MLGLDGDTLTAAARTRLSVPGDVTGVVVTHVFADGPAARAGVQVGDLLVAVDGTPVSDACALTLVAFTRPDCEDAHVTAWRAGQSRTLIIAPADATSVLEKRCSSGDSQACFRRAWLIWSVHKTGPEFARALDRFGTSCRGGSAAGCAYYGVALESQTGRDADRRAALERACTLGDGPGCSHLAYLHATGDLVPRDHVKATAFYETACTRGDSHGCYNLGVNLEGARGVARDLSRARATYARGCDGGNPMACTNLGGLLKDEGAGTPDLPGALVAYTKGCEGSACEGANLLGCVNLARSYRDGIGTAADPARAAELFSAVCEDTIGNAVPAATQQVKACALLGGMHLAGSAPESSAARGRALSERACDGGDDFGCFNAATAHASGLGGPVDEARAATYFESGCTAGDAESCYEFAERLESGRGLPRDRARAKTMRRQACAGGFTKACAAAPRP